MRSALVFTVGLVAAAASCGEEDTTATGGFTDAEMARVRELSPLPELPPQPTNRWADDPAAAALGQKLFFEKTYSGPLAVDGDASNGGLGKKGDVGKVSCASCHVPTGWFHDTRSKPAETSLAVDWTGRNTPTVVNAVFYKSFFWDGRADSMWMQALGPPENPKEMASDRLVIAHVLFDKYRAEYDAVFTPTLDPALDRSHADAKRFPERGGPGTPAWDAMRPEDREHVNRVYANFGKAIEAYERKLVSRNAPFDRFVAGNATAISAAAKRGLKLFIGKAGCVACHSGPFFTDQKFHNTGVRQSGKYVPAEDLGRFGAIPQLLGSEFNAKGSHSDSPRDEHLVGLAATEAEKGRFRTKALRSIAMLGPYLHTGQLATLREVVQFYNRGGDDGGFAGTKDPLMVPLNLSDAEVDDIVKFLETLTGDPIPPGLTQDTSKP